MFTTVKRSENDFTFIYNTCVQSIGMILNQEKRDMRQL